MWPTAVTNCSGSVTVKEDEEIACLCNGTSVNPLPTASWSKNSNVIDGVGYLKETML